MAEHDACKVYGEAQLTFFKIGEVSYRLAKFQAMGIGRLLPGDWAEGEVGCNFSKHSPYRRVERCCVTFGTLFAPLTQDMQCGNVHLAAHLC